MIKLQNKKAGGKECCEADIDMSQLYQNRDQNEAKNRTWILSSESVKLNKGGRSRPLGSFVAGSRSSSKKVCAHACSGEILADGVYSSKRETRSMASGEVRARNTFCKGKIRELS